MGGKGEEVVMGRGRLGRLDHRARSSGFPVLRQRVEFKKGGRCANQEDWNKFITAMKVSE